MKVLVVSDSHGEQENLKSLSLIAKEEKVERIIHLGDDFDDSDFLINESVNIERVPGVFSAYYTEKDVPNRKVIEIEGWKILLTHTKEKHENDLPEDISPENSIKNNTIDIMLYGHSHIPAIGIEGTVYCINPGHLKSEDKRGFEPSYALLDITQDSIDVLIKGLNTKNTILREIIKKQSD
jgi:putative phosphoesterase